jgi:hypothetical protein
MSRAMNQSGVFCMGSRSFLHRDSAEYGFMPLAFGLDPENAIELSWPSNGVLQYTRQNFAYTTYLADRRRILVGISELWLMLKHDTNIKYKHDNIRKYSGKVL